MRLYHFDYEVHYDQLFDQKVIHQFQTRQDYQTFRPQQQALFRKIILHAFHKEAVFQTLF